MISGPRLRRLGWLVSVIVAVGLVASAHYPVFVDDIDDVGRAHVIEDIARSQAFYGRLEPDQVDFYRFEAEAGESISLEALVPKTDDLRSFRPAITISGPGLPDDGMRAPAGAAATSHYEGLTQTYYWSYAAPDEAASAIELSEDGAYEVSVSIDRGEGGPYALVSGNEDSLGPLDVVLFPLEWVRVRLWYFG